LRKTEDSQSSAGMRDPGELEDRWPELWQTMAAVTKALDAARTSDP